MPTERVTAPNGSYYIGLPSVCINVFNAVRPCEASTRRPAGVGRSTDVADAGDRAKPPRHERRGVPECAEDGCSREAAVRLHDPRGVDRDVCADHARAIAQREGVVATPLDGTDAEWP